MFDWVPRRSMRLLLAAVALAVAPLSLGWAMRVSPMVLEMESRGGKAVARIEVQNINKSALAFETRIYRMTFDEKGEMQEVPADDKFLVFPPQGSLPATGRQVMRLQWVGAPDMATSEAYYVSINQLPVALAPVKEGDMAAQVQILYNMRALVVVAPPGATPNVKAASVTPIRFQPPALPGTATGAPPPPVGPGLEVKLANTGRRHAMMSEFGWRLEGTGLDGKPLRVDVTAEELNRAIGTGYVPAVGERTFRFPLVVGFAAKPIKLSFVR